MENQQSQENKMDDEDLIFFPDTSSLKKHVRILIESNRLNDLRKLKRRGLNLRFNFDDIDNTPLLFAAHLGLIEIIKYIVLNELSLLEEDIITLGTVMLFKMNQTNDLGLIHHLNEVVDLWNSRNTSPLPYTFIIHAAFRILRSPPNDLLSQFCESALQLKPELAHDISLKLVLYEETETYWKLLHRGIHLNDIWPINCEENRYSKYYTIHNLFDVYFNYSCLFTIHTSARNKLTKMTIQAANGAAAPSVLYVIQNFPTDLYDDVFKYLILAGFKIPKKDIQRMSHVEIDKAAELINWYKRFYSRPQKLKHLCRLCVRKHLRFNVVYSLRHLILPQDLTRYMLLCDLQDYVNL